MSVKSETGKSPEWLSVKISQSPLEVRSTKFFDDSSKIVDFLLLIKFGSCPVFMDQSLHIITY